jgi:hypothetical protein
MLVAMVITTTLATVVFSNRRAATAYNHHAHAYYGAESGLERGLYYLQYARDAKTIGAQASADSIAAFTGNFSNQTTYTMGSAFVDGHSISLSTGQAGQWDLFGEDYSAGYALVPMTDLNAVEVTWSESDSCTPLTSQVEVSFSSWTAEEWEDITDPATVVTHYVATCPGPGTGDPECDGYSLGLDNTKLYKVRVKAMNCAIEGVVVTALDSSGQAIADLDYVQLTATGDYGGSTPSVSLVAPWNPTLNSYFEYVIFSEDAITK